MLSINVLDEAVILLGVFTVGKKKRIWVYSANKVWWFTICIADEILMLKLPIIYFFSGESFSNNKDIKLSTTLRIDTLHVYVYSLLLVVCNHLLPPAMGIRKKIRRQFYFYFCRPKGQIRQHYNGKNWELWKLWKLSEVVIIILFSAIILFLYMFIRFLLVF